MKVYRIKTGKPVSKRPRNFACLNNKRTDSKVLDPVGRGKPVDAWKNIELFVYNPNDPCPDIFAFGLNYVFSQRAHELLAAAIERNGQSLPLTVKGEAGPHYIFNCTTVIDALDPKKSIWETYLKHPDPNNAKIVVSAFQASRLKKASLFKYCNGGTVGLYVVEHTGDYRDGEFKTMVEHHGLTGLQFELLWSDSEGPVEPHFQYLPEHPFEHRTFEGKKWVYKNAKAQEVEKKSVAKANVDDADDVETEMDSDEDDPRDNYRRKAAPGITVFEVQPVIPSKRGKAKPAPLLIANQENQAFVAPERFCGQPFPDDWKTVELTFGHHKPWQADLYFYGPGALVCSERAQEWLAPLEDEGEFFPVKIKGVSGKYFLFNSTTCLNALDPKRSSWKKSKDGKAELAKPFFLSSRLGEECLFKVLDEGGVRLYCIERCADPYSNEFRALVESTNLTGVVFKKVWSASR